MKLSEKLRQDHDSGDFGEALEGYALKAETLEKALIEAMGWNWFNDDVPPHVVGLCKNALSDFSS